MMSMRMMCAGMVAAATMSAHAAMKIEHTPVTVGVKGQPLMVRAKVAGAGQEIKSLTLFYSTSKDAAPFSVAMQPTGSGGFVGTIPGGILSTLDRVTYYLAAEDAAGSGAETPWYVVRIQNPAAGAEGRPGWVKPVLIGGGVALAAGGIALAVGGSDGGGGGGGGSPTTNDVSGTYVGSSTECQTLSGAAPACESHAATIEISEDGLVSSDNLRPGVIMEATLNGSTFVMVVPIQTSGPDGEIRYTGTVVDNRIVGSIDGSAGSGTDAVLFTGTFSAVRP